MVYSDGEKHYSTEGNADLLGARHWGVLNGLQVTENSTPDMSVLVAAGSCIVNGTEITKTTSTNVSISAADDTNPRWDIITINDVGTIAATAGTPAADPVPPALPANNILLALVYVAAGVTQITNANIYDRRLFIEKIKNVHVDDAAGIAESKLSLNYPTHPRLHAADHSSGGVDEVSLDASQITTGTLSLDRIPNTLTGKDADSIDGYEGADLEKVANKGVANGYCPLDSNGLVPQSNLPDIDADKVDGHDAGTGANNVLVLDNNGLVPLGNIPSALTGKDADLWDGKHRTDDQTIGGDVQIGGNLSVDGYGYFSLYGDEQLRLNNENSLADSLIGIKFSGKDNAGNPQPYGYIYCKILDSTNGSEDAQFEWWLYNNGSKTKQMYLTNGGDLWIGGQLTQSSLKSVKQDIVSFDLDSFDILDQTEVKKFRLKNDKKRVHYGFIAEEVPDVFKSFDRDGKLIGINITHILAVLFDAVKKLKKEVKNLENKTNGNSF